MLLLDYGDSLAKIKGMAKSIAGTWRPTVTEPADAKHSSEASPGPVTPRLAHGEFRGQTFCGFLIPIVFAEHIEALVLSVHSSACTSPKLKSISIPFDFSGNSPDS